MFFLKDDNKVIFDNVKSMEDTKDAHGTGPVLCNGGMEILPSSLHSQIASQVSCSIIAKSLLRGKDMLKHISVAEVLQSDFGGSDNIKKILHSSSDLIPGVYEGGFKIWECTYDLIDYLRNNSQKLFVEEDTHVLDLGCGSGLLGLYMLSCGAHVHFHDYNPEVIKLLTIPNVILNFGEAKLARARFFSGDWSSFQNSNPNIKLEARYDYILSSETIYNIENLNKLYELVLLHLKPTGKLYLAAKTCYFGVGGGTIFFRNLIESDGRMQCEVVDIIRSGVQREVLSITFKS